MPAIVYTGPGGLFTRLGVLISRINSYGALGTTTLPADLAAVLAGLGTSWLPSEGVAARYESMRDDVTAWRRGLARFCDRILTDRDTVQVPLGLTNASQAQVLAALIRRMRDDGQTVKACTVTAGAVSA